MFSEKGTLIAAFQQIPVHFDIPEVGVHRRYGRQGYPGKQKLWVIVGVVGQDGSHQRQAVFYCVEHIRLAKVAVVVAKSQALQDAV